MSLPKFTSDEDIQAAVSDVFIATLEWRPEFVDEASDVSISIAGFLGMDPDISEAEGGITLNLLHILATISPDRARAILDALAVAAKA